MTGLSGLLNGIVRKHMDAGAISGGIVLVQRAGETVDLQAHGVADVDPAFRLEPDTIFAVASMTKPVTAACAMMLVSEGKLSLDDPASKYIPEFAKPRRVRTLRPGEAYPPFPLPPDAAPPPEPKYDYAPADREITVRHLLSFTSGLQTIGVPNGMPPVLPDDSLASFVAKLGDVPLEFQPGTRWHYSNATGYDVLGRIIEVASGRSFQEFARERLFEPLGMSQTQFGADGSKADRLLPLDPFLAGAPIVRTDYPSGSAGLFSTAEDYAKFAQMLLDDGVCGGRAVMAAEAAQAMRRPQIGDLPFEGIRVSEYARPIHSRPSPFTYGFGVGVLAQASPQVSLPAGSYGWDGVGTRRFWVVPALRLVLVMLVPGLGAAADPLHQALEAAATRWAAA